MVNVYIETKDAPELTPMLVFWPNYRFAFKEKAVFSPEIMASYTTPFFTIVPGLEAADFIAVPYHYFDVLDYAPKYLAYVYALGKTTQKKVLLFDYTDYVEREIHVPSHAILFRVSAYRHHKKENEIIMPYFVEDIGRNYSFEQKPKGEKPTVGYCGQSRFGGTTRKWKAGVKWLLSLFLLYLRLDVKPHVHMRGIFWRRRALQVLSKSKSIVSRIIERDFYSLYRAIPFDAKTIRREYVENLRENVLALSVRGDANASQRFYEALSAGRIPLFLDTDCVLPLEEIIDYSRIILRVPAQEVDAISRRVTVWHALVSEGDVLQAGREAREVYERYLRLEKFFSIVFDREKSPYKKLLFR
ncbi:MAG: hypothetical protein A2849_01090 [Candidatus Taylorbacteria bacterium RIFCSPHIGHO2_01_FULL_51_15]|uniref:Exostosin GT47 domain-containing protein n=1 Tax=Candidatus Taylorbacteria bacterium RIFCSPHIGHO2_01_FULL_51_15 TaxID=1802304 RepID=A0A1G2M9D2_9BACT|nr:MAG: hypothetical protein A2849_01090 [Candidatus Taylorbacteria bacterium RIFCSPHIGHO2_01_FULL_51_15]